MILADCHTHSLCSPDSEAPMPAMAQRATELGLTTLCLTDHCDLLRRRPSSASRALTLSSVPVTIWTRRTAAGTFTC